MINVPHLRPEMIHLVSPFSCRTKPLTVRAALSFLWGGKYLFLDERALVFLSEHLEFIPSWWLGKAIYFPPNHDPHTYDGLVRFMCPHQGECNFYSDPLDFMWEENREGRPYRWVAVVA